MKKESGAQGRKRRKLEAEQARREEAARRAALVGEAGADLPPHLAHFGNLGPPPRDAVGGVAWGNSLAQLIAWEIVTDPYLDARERRKLALEAIKMIALSTNRAHVAERLKFVTDRLATKRDLSGGPKSLRGVARPATARGGASDPIATDKGEDETQ